MRKLEEVIIEAEGGGLLGFSMANLLISTPIKANGAQPEIAHGMPHMDTKKVATATDLANGANIMVAANMKCEISHAVCKSGRAVLIFLSNAARPGGGRGVKPGFRLSGLRIPKGRNTELINVMSEKITSDKLPIRPTSPNVSVDCVADSGF